MLTIRRIGSVCLLRSPRRTCDRFSCGTFMLRTAAVPVAGGDRAASFAARMAGAGEQPGRERPHLRTPDPDPTVGSGVAHAPAAGNWNRSDLLPESRAESERDLRAQLHNNSGAEFG